MVMVSLRVNTADIAAPGPPVIRGLYNGQAVFTSMGYEKNGVWKWDQWGTGKSEMRFTHSEACNIVRLEVYFPYDAKNLGPIYYTGQVDISKIFKEIQKLSKQGTILDTQYARDDLIELKAANRQAAKEVGATHGSVRMRVALELPQFAPIDACSFHIVSCPQGIGEISIEQLKRERAMGFPRGKGMAGKTPNTINYVGPIPGEAAYVERRPKGKGKGKGYGKGKGRPPAPPPGYGKGGGKGGKGMGKGGGMNYMPPPPMMDTPYNPGPLFHRSQTDSPYMLGPVHNGIAVDSFHRSSSGFVPQINHKYGPGGSNDSLGAANLGASNSFGAGTSKAWETSRSWNNSFDRSGTGLGAAAMASGGPLQPRRMSLSGGYSTVGVGAAAAKNDLSMPSMPELLMDDDTIASASFRDDASVYF